MRISLLAFGLFTAAFFSHWLVWQIRLPRRQTAVLLAILLGMLPAGLAVILFLPSLHAWCPIGFWGCMHIAMFHVAMSLAYAVVYTALEERSPSMTLLVFVADSKDRGRTREELFAALKNLLPVEVRLSAMLRDNMVAYVGGVYVLTAKGRVWALASSAWVRLTNMPKGG